MNGLNMVAGQGPQNDSEVVIDETKARNGNYHVGDMIKPLNTRRNIASPESIHLNRAPRVKMSLEAYAESD